MTAPTGLCPTRCHHAEANVPCPGRVYVDLQGNVVERAS